MPTKGSTTRIARICETCRANFLAHPSDIKRGSGRFCSLSCHRFEPPEIRLWSGTKRSDTCWLRTVAINGHGYSHIRVEHKLLRAHCYAWMLRTGQPIPAGKIIGHTCDERACVRNDEEGTYEVRGVALPRFGHLFLATTAQNNQDCVDKGHHPWTNRGQHG